MVPEFFRVPLIVGLAAVTLAWIISSLVHFVDWTLFGEVLASTEHRETLCWMVGVPTLVVFCLLAAQTLQMYLLAVGVVATVGMLITIYTLDVYRRVAASESYHASCDLANRVSCTETLKAPSSKLVFGIRNADLGLLFYTSILVNCLLLAISPSGTYFPVWILFILCFGGMLASVYLLFLSLAVLQLVCPVCMGAHLVNFALLWLAWGLSEEMRW